MEIMVIVDGVDFSTDQVVFKAYCDRKNTGEMLVFSDLSDNDFRAMCEDEFVADYAIANLFGVDTEDVKARRFASDMSHASVIKHNVSKAFDLLGYAGAFIMMM